MRSGSVRVKCLLFFTHFTHCSTLWQASQPRSFEIAEMHWIVTYLSLWKVESYLLQNHISSSLPTSPSATNLFFLNPNLMLHVQCLDQHLKKKHDNWPKDEQRQCNLSPTMLCDTCLLYFVAEDFMLGEDLFACLSHPRITTDSLVQNKIVKA